MLTSNFVFIAVCSGNVVKFAKVLKRYADQFKTDFTYTLILRLHHNVIKTAIRTISLAYSRIEFKDVAKKLVLEWAEDAEFIIILSPNFPIGNPGDNKQDRLKAKICWSLISISTMGCTEFVG